jgi:branched-chain amino acid transport system permease protein
MYGSPPARALLPLIALIVAAFALQRLLPQYFLYIGNMLMMYTILVIGLDLLIGWSGQFAFAHIAFFGMGIYTTTVLGLRFGVPFVLAMPIAALGAGVIGLLIAIPATRLRTVYLALATFAFAECAQWIARTWESVTKGSDGLQIAAPSIFGYAIGNDERAFPVVAIILALVLLATMYLQHSKFARSLCAIRESEHVAAASGIDVKRAKVLSFALSAVYAGVAGGVYTLFNSFINPDTLGVSQLVLVLTMLVVGGSGSIAGAVIGVVLVGILPEVLRAAPRSMLVWQEFLYGLILLLAIMFMPRGIWGAWKQWREPLRPRVEARPATDATRAVSTKGVA